MDGRLKKDREYLIDEWGDLPPEARLYLLSKVANRRLYKMSRKTKSVVIGGTLLVGAWSIWFAISVLHIEPWPLALVIGVLIGLIIGIISKI